MFKFKCRPKIQNGDKFTVEGHYNIKRSFLNKITFGLFGSVDKELVEYTVFGLDDNKFPMEE